eukprot:3462918-Rhodomonas_salina.2
MEGKDVSRRHASVPGLAQAQPLAALVFPAKPSELPDHSLAPASRGARLNISAVAHFLEVGERSAPCDVGDQLQRAVHVRQVRRDCTREVRIELSTRRVMCVSALRIHCACPFLLCMSSFSTRECFVPTLLGVRARRDEDDVRNRQRIS